MFGFITGNLWKAGCIAAATACIALTATVGVVTLQRNAARTEAAAIRLSIDDPINGWRVRHATEQANAKRLDAALTQQNAAVDAMRADSATRIAAAERGWRDAQRAAAAARNSAERIGASQIHGATTCERVEDVDAQILEALR